MNYFEHYVNDIVMESFLHKDYKVNNLNKWGKDPKHNILYITGYSGSGKSTLANNIADENTNVIHLDPYLEKMDERIAIPIQDNEFNEYLKKYYPIYTTLSNPAHGDEERKKKWKILDTFMNHSEKFAEKQFKKGKKVIVEGLQLSDDTVYPNKDFFKDKPIVIVNTNAFISFLRALKRDEKSLLLSPKSAKEYIDWYFFMYKRMNKLSNITKSKRTDHIL